ADAHRSLCSLPLITDESLLSFYVVDARGPYLTLFPYTTLFRSVDMGESAGERPAPEIEPGVYLDSARLHRGEVLALAVGPGRARSEEHTSELQSRENLVCRLLLEKKKIGILSRNRIMFWIDVPLVISLTSRSLSLPIPHVVAMKYYSASKLNPLVVLVFAYSVC